jgi:hypothetical protein
VERKNANKPKTI